MPRPSSPQHVQESPERASPLWVRHRAASLWCIAESIDASVITLCRGRFDASEDYAIDADAPEHVRCGGCEAKWTRQKHEAALCSLSDLVANMPKSDAADAWIEWFAENGVESTDDAEAFNEGNAPEPTRMERAEVDTEATK